jgi:riboflavin synthase
MFTGLIEEIGKVNKLIKGEKAYRINVFGQKVLDDVKVGDSISTNGVCLTVTEFNKEGFWADIMPETAKKSNLSSLKCGSEVNLERALQVGSRLGGHMVAGHVDGIGTVESINPDENAIIITISAKSNILKYIIDKGSICINGISLTVVNAGMETFSVSIIPTTQDETTLRNIKIGDIVNLECDLVGKYIERFSKFENVNSTKSKIDLNFLVENGFA